MKTYLSFLLLFTINTIIAQQKMPDKNKPVINAEAACGQCQFKLAGKGCNLAVRINGKAYFADGVHIDSLGDAHAADGFCNAIRKVNVQGVVVNKRFKANYIKLLPVVAVKE